MDFGLTLQTDPPASRLIGLFQRAEALGFTHAWTFDSHILWQEPYVIHSQDALRDRADHGRPLRHQPGDARPDRHGLGVRDAQRHVRQPHGLRHRARRLGRCACWRASRRRSPRPSGRSTRSASSPRGARSRGPTAPRCASRGSATGGWRSGWPPTARRRWRSSAAAPTASCSRWPTRRSCAGPSPHVREAAEEAGRDPDDITVLVCAPGLRRRRHRPRARPVPLVRRHGRQPRRRDRRALRRATARSPPRSPTTSRRARATTTRTTAAPGTRTPSSSPTRSSTASASSATPAAHVAKLEELRDAGMDQFAIYLMHDAPDRTLEAYGAEVIPAFAEA